MKYKISEKLIDILRTFSKTDIKNFKKFLMSPFINPYPKTLRLFNTIVKYYPDFPLDKMDRKEIFRQMKTGVLYNDSTMRDILSKLKDLAEKYLAYLNFSNDNLIFNSSFRKELNARKLYNQIDENIISTEKTLKSLKVGVQSFYQLGKLEIDKFNNAVVNKKINNKRNLNTALTYLNNSAKYQLGLFVLEIINQNDTILKITKRQERVQSRNIIPELLKPINLKKVIITLRRNDEELSHIFQIYYYLYMLFSARKDEQYFHLFRESIIANSGKISADEIHFLFGRLIDYCVNKCNEGRAEYYNELANAYMIMLEHGYYTNSSNKYISQDLFRNIFQTAIRTKNTKWAEGFISKYRNDLHPLDRDNMYFYCYSYIYFEGGNPQKALEYILKIKQDYFTLKIDIKILLLKIYFELGMYEHVYNQLDSFKHFITNHEHITPDKRRKLKDFMKYYAKILKAQLNDDKVSAVFLSNELYAKQDKQFYDWLYKKAESVRIKETMFSEC